MKEIPIYLFTGFLEAGKTKFIQETLEDKRFNAKERTLLLLCEEGFEEYDESRFTGKDVFIEIIEQQNDLTEERLNQFISKHKPDRILAEMNGMWQLDTFYDSLPKPCMVVQEMLFINAQTFESYNNNMRSLVVDKLKSSEVVVFNRTAESTDKALFHKIVRATSRRASIIFEYTDGKVEYDETEDPLPFETEGDEVVIQDEDFALWYRDVQENPKKYINKIVRFLGIVAHNETLPKDLCLIGRHIMTCCADDISYGGMLCILPKGAMVQNRDWMFVTARLKFEKHKLYKGKGPVLYAESLVHAAEPKEVIATFY